MSKFSKNMMLGLLIVVSHLILLGQAIDGNSKVSDSNRNASRMVAGGRKANRINDFDVESEGEATHLNEENGDMDINQALNRLYDVFRNQENTPNEVQWRHLANGGGSRCLSTFNEANGETSVICRTMEDPNWIPMDPLHFRIKELQVMDRDVCVQDFNSKVYCTDFDSKSFYDISTKSYFIIRGFRSFKMEGSNKVALQTQGDWKDAVEHIQYNLRTFVFVSVGVDAAFAK
jgi:hypothetical protein